MYESRQKKRLEEENNKKETEEQDKKIKENEDKNELKWSRVTENGVAHEEEC